MVLLKPVVYIHQVFRKVVVVVVVVVVGGDIGSFLWIWGRILGIGQKIPNFLFVKIV